MANETFAPTSSHGAGTLIGGVSSSENGSQLVVRIDPTTKRLLVDSNATLTGSSVPIAGAATAVGVAIVDGSGNQITSFGGGTQYTEDAAAAANPVGTAMILVREDGRAGSLTTTDGDNVAARGNNKGELYVKTTDSDALLTTIDADTSSIDGKLPVLGQALAAASIPVILPSATITTLTPPAAITGFATSAKQDTIIGHIDSLESIFTDVIGYETTTNLTSGSTYSSGLLTLSPPYSQVLTNILSDRTGTMYVYWYSDAGGTDLVRTLTIAYTAGDGFLSFGAPAFTRYVKYEFTNSVGGTQADFYFLTKFLTKPSNAQLATLASPLSTGMVGEVTRSILVGQSSAGGGSFVNVKVNPSGTLETNSNLAAGTNNIGDVDVLTMPVVAVTQSGTWDEVGINDSGNSITVDGTFWQSTQPVSIATAPVLVAGSALIGKVGIDQVTANANEVVTKTGSVTAATLAAETTKVIGTVNQGTSPWVVTGGGGGTEYVTNAVAPADPTGTTLVSERDDQLATLTEVEGDWTNTRATSKGALWVAIPDTNGDPITSFGGGTQYAVDTALGATPTGTLAVAIRDDALSALTPVEGDAIGVRVDANGALWVIPSGTTVVSGAVTNTVLSVVGTGTEATAQRVTIATDSTGVLSVDDNGGNISIDDGGNTITVDGAVTTSGTVTEANSAAILTSTQLVDDIVYTDDTSTHATGTSKGALIMAAATPTDTAVNANDIGAVGMTNNRAMYVAVQDAIPAGTNNIGDVDILSITAAAATNKVDVGLVNGEAVDVGAGTEAAAIRVTLPTNGTGVIAGVTTVTTVTNQSQEGGVAISLNAGAVDTGTRRVIQANGAGKTILSTGGSASASGNNTLVAAGSARLKVFAFTLSTISTTAMTCIFQSGASGTEIWRCVLQAGTSVSTGANLTVSPPAWLFATASATLLNLNLSSANAVHWSVSYFDEA